MGAPLFHATLTRSRELTPSVRAFTFARDDGAAMQFVAGQWVNVMIPTPEGVLKRAYSVASPPGPSPEFELAVTHVAGGAGSKSLHDMSPGISLEFTEPQGFFVRKEDHPSLFIATGTGITPLLSMARHALDSGDKSPMTMLVGVRHEEDRLYAAELMALEHAHPQFRAHYTLSQPHQNAPLQGHVQLHLPRLYRELCEQAGGAKAHIYICGLEKMVKSVREVCKGELELTREWIHSERYD